MFSRTIKLTISLALLISLPQGDCSGQQPLQMSVPPPPTITDPKEIFKMSNVQLQALQVGLKAETDSALQEFHLKFYERISDEDRESLFEALEKSETSYNHLVELVEKIK